MQVMQRLTSMLFVGVALGYAAGTVNSVLANRPQTPAAQRAPVQTDLPAARTAAPPDIAPVANPPLYPDPPNRPMHWSAEHLRKVFQARMAASKGDRNDTIGGAATFQSQSFRTHSIGATFRMKFDTPRRSNRAGVMSLVDDADQHEGVTDLYVIFGGTGQMVTGGEIANRVYGTNPRGAAASGRPITVVYGGEFNGQPIVNGHTIDVKPGDWLAIPPNVAHWPGYNPGSGLMYVMLKVNLGYYPPNLMY
jgi:mannose-6-phosphate isomerase-like protein (cupin superfamily)